jgi:hypothetical protein
VELSHDLLGELIAELERAFPAADTPGRYEVLPRLEDLQAVIGPILFASKEEQGRILADPQYQHLHAKVMRQLAHQPDDQPIAAPTELISDPEP